MAAEVMYVTPSGAGSKDGSSWANAFGLAEWETDVETAAEAGDIYYVEGGTYTLTGDWNTTRAGAATAPIMVIGVAPGTTAEPPVLADWASGSDRPLIEAGANKFNHGGNYWEICNLRVNSANVRGFETYPSGHMVLYNCYSRNTTATANRYAYYGYSNTRWIKCEGICDNGYGFAYIYGYCLFWGCYIHDSVIGISLSNHYNRIMFSIIDTCSTSGINLASFDGHIIIGNTIYNCGDGIKATDSKFNVILNNIIDSCTTGANWSTAEQKCDFWDYNNWNNNTTDTTNVTKGVHATALDPEFTDAPNGDFSIGTNLKAGGFPGLFPGGLSEGYLDVGAVQREETEGEHSYAMVG